MYNFNPGFQQRILKSTFVTGRLYTETYGIVNEDKIKGKVKSNINENSLEICPSEIWYLYWLFFPNSVYVVLDYTYIDIIYKFEYL